MMKDSLRALGESARDLFRNPRGLLLLAAVYAALLASVYVFFATGVATTWQLAYGTALAALAAPALFLLLQAGAAKAALPGANGGAVARGMFRDFLKVLLLAVPVAALAVGLFYLLGKLPDWLPKVAEAPRAVVEATGDARPSPLHWQEALTTTLWLVLLGFVVPLLAAHLWLASSREGLGRTLKSLHRVAGRAFASRSVLVYAVGFFVFALTPYFVVYSRPPVSSGWAELTLFGLRLALAFALTLLGWVVTLGALARVTPPLAESPVASEPAPAPPPAEPEPAAAEPQLQA
jgi:hypothetical protein